MLSIGEFARRGRVSVRMLRHYDAIGLLPPAHVDPATGYRFYHARQLARLGRIVTLKDLGFTLQKVQAILDEQVDDEELFGMLRLRRAELHAQIAADSTRLAQVEERLQSIDGGGHAPADDALPGCIPPARIAPQEVPDGDGEGAGPPGAQAHRSAIAGSATLRASWLCPSAAQWAQSAGQLHELTGLRLLTPAQTDAGTT